MYATFFMPLSLLEWCQKRSVFRVVNITVLVLVPIISVIVFKYWHKYWRYFFTYFIGSIWLPTLLSLGALVKSVNSNITVTERVKTRTVVLHLK